MPYALRFAEGALYAGFSDGGLLVSEDRAESWRDVPLSGEALASVVALMALD